MAFLLPCCLSPSASAPCLKRDLDNNKRLCLATEYVTPQLQLQRTHGLAFF